MSNIIVDYNAPIQNGTEVVFRSPEDCSLITGLKVNYSGGSQEFMLADAHGNNVGDIDHLFAKDVVVKVILDVDNGMAFVQNPDTNSYLEYRFGMLADSIVGEATGSVITLNDSSNRELQGLTISNTDAESVTVKVMGKNLYNIDYSAINRKDINNGDPNVEHLENGVIVQGKNSNNTGSSTWANGWLNLQYHPRVYLTKGDVVRISYDFTILEKLDGVTPTKWSALLYGASQYEAVSRWDTFNVGEKVKMSAMHTIGVSGEYYPIITLNSCKAKIENIQIEYGSVSTDYEPYKEAQTLVVSIPNGLGADGFVCEDFAQLHTYKPNTTITNDVGAIMEVEYVADTKAYIDNKFTELQNAILASGANV